MVSAHPTGHFYAAGFGHLDVQHSDVRNVLCNQPFSLFTVLCFGYNLDVFSVFQDLPDSSSDDGVVIGK
jgi:hypothetical protein